MKHTVHYIYASSFGFFLRHNQCFIMISNALHASLYWNPVKATPVVMNVFREYTSFYQYYVIRDFLKTACHLFITYIIFIFYSIGRGSSAISWEGFFRNIFYHKIQWTSSPYHFYYCHAVIDEPIRSLRLLRTIPYCYCSFLSRSLMRAGLSTAEFG